MSLKSSWIIVGLAVVVGGQTVVTDAQSGVLQVIDPMTWSANRQLQDYRLTTPTCIASGVPRKNDVYVADGARAVVIVFDAISGSVIREFGADDGPGRLAKPIPFVVDDVDRVHILDKEHRQVFVFNGGNGEFIGAINMTGFVDPRDIAVKNKPQPGRERPVPRWPSLHRRRRTRRSHDGVVRIFAVDRHGSETQRFKAFVRRWRWMRRGG